ncbi:MAG TPA: translation initiation factor 2 [Cellulomonadaceae bacterium]|nr:translation initiation factor 2 [Cellulomonadaceae bacterium]
MTSEQVKEAEKRLSDAAKAARVELEKTGTPEYDSRAHQRAVEEERNAQEALDQARATA